MTKTGFSKLLSQAGYNPQTLLSSRRYPNWVHWTLDTYDFENMSSGDCGRSFPEDEPPYRQGGHVEVFWDNGGTLWLERWRDDKARWESWMFEIEDGEVYEETGRPRHEEDRIR